MLRTESPKITIVTALAACLLLGTTLVAAAPPPGPLNGPDPARFAARFLDLSDAQMQAWRAILEARDEATRPIAREVERRERELHRLLDADAQDPAAVGALVVAIDGLRDQIDAIRGSSGQELLGTL
ncbi:MAG: periplasmic heavy metal sensor, partial [Acidobacteriota bacterium]